jgi:hypothetical protein
MGAVRVVTRDEICHILRNKCMAMKGILRRHCRYCRVEVRDRLLEQIKEIMELADKLED